LRWAREWVGLGGVATFARSAQHGKAQRNRGVFIAFHREACAVAGAGDDRVPDAWGRDIVAVRFGYRVEPRTWNEATHDITDPSISTIVVGAIVDTGAIMLLALAASLGFGGFRILAKLILPGKIFDRNTDVEILQLGINSKPVDVKDFYILNTPR